jgi:hypothetical protein
MEEEYYFGLSMYRQVAEGRMDLRELTASDPTKEKRIQGLRVVITRPFVKNCPARVSPPHETYDTRAEATFRTASEPHR